MVVRSVYSKDAFLFNEYPTPAGDYIKSKFERLCQE